MKKTKKPFDNIIGYKEIKNELIMLLDVLNNKDKYKKIGADAPKGLLLYGAPGTGKTTMAMEFLKHSNRKSIIIRKTNGAFLNYLNNKFDEAKKMQPSIILLDDLDKFAESSGNVFNNKEFITVQSLIDSVKDEYVFIIATANDKRLLPESLLRSGRFDIQLLIDEPDDIDIYNIFEYYLKDKKLAKDVNIDNITTILIGCSCADLEKVCNQASIYAGFNNSEEIQMEDLLRAALEFAYDTTIDDLYKEDSYSIRTAYHEAGHTLVAELLEPRSTRYVTNILTDSDTLGLTAHQNNEHYFSNIEFMENRIKTLLAGKASTEIVYNTCDTGCNSDLQRAYDIASRFVGDYGLFGFDSFFGAHRYESEKTKQSKDERTNELLNNYYNDVLKILMQNRRTLDVLARQLNSKKILFQDEIQQIIKGEIFL